MTFDQAGSPDAFAQMVRGAQVVVGDASVAVVVGTAYLDVTRSFARWSYRIDSLSDVKCYPARAPLAEEQRVPTSRPSLRRRSSRRRRRSANGWNVTVWMIYDRSLVRHDLAIAADDVIQDSPDVVADNIPVPYSM